MSILSTKPRRKEKNLSFFFLKAFVIKYKVEDGGWCSKDVRESYGKPLERIEIFWLVELPSRLGMCEGLDKWCGDEPLCDTLSLFFLLLLLLRRLR